MNKDLFKRLLEYYQIDENDYANLIRPVSSKTFAHGHKFDHIDEAVKMVKEVMSQNGKIFIYGDYDADGVMGTSILVKMFKYLNYEVESYLPNRYQDGYGLTLKKAQECIDNKVDLLITVDNGVSCLEQIALLKNNNVKVLVIDHHEIGENIPNADYIIHPIYSHFGQTPSSGAFTAFVFSIAFLGRFDKYLSTLAAISLISDMMPLKEYNRDLLRIVIENYRDGEFYQIDALKDGDPFDENAIGMRIAPKINAIGRMIDGNDINRLVHYFTEDQIDNLLHYITWINDINELRKTLSKEAVDNLGDIDQSLGAIIYVTDAKEGILGLIANHICNKYHLPTIVLTENVEKKELKGSCRAPEGFNIAEAFRKLSSLMIAGGGHAQAGGCTIAIEQFEQFKNAFIDLCKSSPIVYVEKPSVQILMNEINLDNYNLIKTFSPFGEAWKSPIFKLANINAKSLHYSKTGEHIFTSIGNQSRLVGFNISRQSLSDQHFIDLLGSFSISSFRGVQTLDFLIKEIIKDK